MCEGRTDTGLAGPGLADPGLAGPGLAEHAVVDVSDPAAVTALAEGIVALHGRLDATFTAGLRQDPFGSFPYVVAKAGVVNLVRQAALDLARWQVRVNAIAPAPFRTNIGGKGPLPAAARARWNATVPLGRMGDPAEIAGLALLLASGASSFMTGGVYLVDGGQMLQSLPLPEPSARTPSGENVAGESLPAQ